MYFSAILLVLAFILLIYFVITLVQKGRKFILRRQASTASSSQLNCDVTATVANAVAKQKTSVRLISLDAFRGLAIVAMIFANSGAGKYHWFEHATWNGLHPADVIFPSFLWIMGVCIPISQKSQFARNIPRHEMLTSILIVRCFSIFNNKPACSTHVVNFSTNELNTLLIIYFSLP